MFLVENQRLAYVSGAFATWFDTDATALTGRPVDAVVASHDWDGFEAALARVQEADGLASTTCRCRLVTATEWAPVVIELVALPGRRGVVGSVQADVTLERTRDELATARDRFGHLFDLVQDAVVEFEIVETIPVVRSVNPAFEEVFGYDADAVVGESLNDVIVPDTLARRALSFDRRSADGEYNEATVARETATGIRQFQYRGVPYEHDGASHALAIYTDVTEQRRREQHHAGDVAGHLVAYEFDRVRWSRHSRHSLVNHLVCDG